jgi:histidinol-phosphate/aromatic aminotransferase/cobyric acid decarboxylase-like protein
VPELHGGNLDAAARRLGCRPEQLLDASASLVPFRPPLVLRRALNRAALRPYPDRGYLALRRVIAARHGLDPAWVLPGNGAAELFTWAARDAAAAGPSLLPQPGFADYRRALRCWDGAEQPWPLPRGRLPFRRCRPLLVVVTPRAPCGSPTPTTPPGSSGVAPASSPCCSALPW